MQEVTIIGGGIIGLSCAYYLNKEGYEVTVIDRGDITDGCSFGNMGFISPSHFIPLASPGIISEGFRYMLSSDSPFYIKPRLNIDLIKWCWTFYRSSNSNNSRKNSLPLHNLLQLSRSLINEMKTEIGTSGFYEKGCLMMCKNKYTLDHEFEIAKAAEDLGLKIEMLDANDVQQLEPDVEVAVAGAVLFKDDCHFDPGKSMTDLKKYLENMGIKFQLNTKVTGFEINNKKVKAVITDKGKFNCNNVIIATGSWLPDVAGMLGIRLLLQPGKGYSYTYDYVEKNIKYPAILVDGRCAISPWENRLRIGGTMELSGINDKVIFKRMQGIYESVKEFYPGLDIPVPPADKIWHGLRPVTPDGLPYIGKFEQFENVIIAGGHAMLGLSMGTGTGKLVCQIIGNEETDIDITAFNPQRF